MTEIATRGLLQNVVFVKKLQNLQKNACASLFFNKDIGLTLQLDFFICYLVASQPNLGQC